MHMVQLLSLEDCSKYSAEQACHQSVEHECCLTVAPWQSSFGPHELLRFHGTINERRVRVLVDDGSTHNFLNYTLVKKLRLAQVPSSHKYVVSLMNGIDTDVWDKEVKDVSLEVQGHMMKLDFHVMHMTRADVVLGREWLHSLGSSLTRSYQHNTLAFEDNGVHVLIMGESEVPATPLICNAKLSYLIQRNEIEDLHFCYFMSPSFSHVENVSCDDDIVGQSSLSDNVTHMMTSLLLKEPSSAMHSSNVNLSSNQTNVTSLVQRLINDYKDVFPADLPPSLPPDRTITHGIDLMDGSKPVSRPPYRLSASEASEVEKQLADLIQRGFIRSSNSPWAAPILLVKKKDGSMRM